MKKSEELQKELQELEEADKSLCKEMVFDANPDGNPEKHEKLWCKYWQEFGKENAKTKEWLEREIRKERNREVQVGDGVTECLWSDRHAGTVISRTQTKLVMQYDKATLKASFKPEFIEGGFCGHCVNSDEQDYTYERDENGRTAVFHWSEKYGRWCRGEDQSIKLTLGRHEFYDYNF